MDKYTFEIKNGVYKQPQYEYRNTSKDPMWVDYNIVFTGYKIFYAFWDANEPYQHPYKIEACKFKEWRKAHKDIEISFGFKEDIPKVRIEMFDEIEGNGGQQYSGEDIGCCSACTTLAD